MSTPRRAESASILRLSAPLIVSFWLRAAFQWVDTVYATYLEGLEDASVAAIGLAVPFEFMLIACWVGASNGLTARLSAALGARQGERIEELKRAARRLVTVLIALFLLLALGIWLGAEHVGLEPDLARQFRVYATVLIGGSAFTAFWSVLPDSLVKAHHDTKSTMWAGIVSTVMNVVLNTIFVFVFHWGIFGIAFSTVLSRLGGLAYAQRVANRHERRRLAAGLDTAPGVDPRPTRSILAIAVPAALTFLLMAAEGMAINGLFVLTAEQGSNLAAWSIFDRAVRFLAMPPIAISVAALPLAARYFGQRDFGAVRAELRTALIASSAYVVVFVAPLSWALWPWVSTTLSSSPATRAFTDQGQLYLPLAVLASAPLFILRSAFEGLQRPGPGLIVAGLRALLVVCLTWVGIRAAARTGYDEIAGAYAGSTLAIAVAAAVMVVWIRRELTRCARAVPEPGAATGERA